MKLNQFAKVLALGTMMIGTASAEEKKKPSWEISPLGWLRFNTQLMDIGSDESESSWNVKRAYVGVNAKSSSGVKAKLVYDAAAKTWTEADGKQRYQGFLKEAWSSLPLFVEGLSVKAGLQVESHVIRSLPVWNRYYLRGPLNTMTFKETTADLGVTASFSKNKMFADLGVVQGSGFTNISSKMETEKYQLTTGYKCEKLNAGVWASYRPYRHDENDMMEAEAKQLLFVGYTLPKFHVGLEAGNVMNLKGKSASAADIQAVALSMMVNALPKTQFIVREELAQNGEEESGTSYLLVALEYSFQPKTRVAAKYERTGSEKSDIDPKHSAGVGLEVIF